MNPENEKLVRWHEEGINQQQPDLALELCTDDFQFHFAFTTPDYPEGAAALRHWLIGTFDFFPDFRPLSLRFLMDFVPPKSLSRDREPDSS